MKIKIKLSDGKYLVAEKYKYKEEHHAQICIYVQDKSGEVLQDICCIQPHYKVKDGKVDVNDKYIDCSLWLDEKTINCTNRMVITRREV